MTQQISTTTTSGYVKVAGTTDGCLGLIRGVNGTHAVIQSDTQPAIDDLPMAIYSPGSEDYIKLKSGDYLWILLMFGDGDNEGMATFTNFDETVTDGQVTDTSVLFANVLDGNWEGSDTVIDNLYIDDDGFIHAIASFTRELETPFTEGMGTLAVCFRHDGELYNYCLGGSAKITSGGNSVSFGGFTLNGGYRPVFGDVWKWVTEQDMLDAGFVYGDTLTLEYENGPNSPRQSLTGWSDVHQQSQGIPTIVLTFDDGYDSVYDFYDYYVANGIRGTICLPWDRVGTYGYLSLSQLTDLKDIGWDIQLDGTSGDQRMTNLGDVATAVAELDEGKQFLIDNGLNDNPRHFCYPEGVYGNFPDRVYATGVTGAIGSNVLTVSLSDAAEIQVGWNVGSRNLPEVTLVTAVDTETGEITIDQTISNTGRLGESISALVPNVLFEDATDPFYYNNLPRALQDAGYKIGRTTAFSTFHTKLGFGDFGIIAPGKGFGTDPVTRIKGITADIIAEGTTCIMYTHRLDVAASEDLHLSPEDFTECMEHLIALRDAGEIALITLDELYIRDNSEA